MRSSAHCSVVYLNYGFHIALAPCQGQLVVGFKPYQCNEISLSKLNPNETIFTGTSSVARGLTGYIDALFDKQMERYLRDTMPIDVSFLGRYPDWLSFIVIMLLAVLLSIGVKESSFLNNIFTCVNMATICLVIVAGAFKCRFSLNILELILFKYLL